MEYPEDGVGARFGAAETTAAWYLDILDGEIKTAASHNRSFDLDEFTYIKVTTDVQELKVMLAAEGKEPVTVGTNKGRGARTVYFALDALKKDGKLSGLDTVQVSARGGTVNLVTAVTGLPLKEGDLPQYVQGPDGTETLLAE